MPLILPARTLDSGYEISNSLRFNRGDGADLSRAPSSDGNRKTFTFSAWVKLGNIPWDKSQDFDIFSANSTNNFNDNLRFDANGKLTLLTKVSGDTDNGVKGSSTRLFRDSSAWYHIVVALDTTQATNTNGFKMYVNGVQETISFNSYNQNISTSFNKSGSTMAIGHRQNDGGNHYDGYISEVHFIDGTQLDASSFGETNDNGVWIPKKYSGSFGTNGFKHEYKQSGTGTDASGIGADTSGNDNHFAVTNLTANDNCTDSPTNNFCTLNPLDVYASKTGTLSEGNCKLTVTASQLHTAVGTIAPTSGKWYWEIMLDNTDGSNPSGLGITNLDEDDKSNMPSKKTWGYGYMASTGNKQNNGNNSSYGDSYTSNDKLSVAMDLDNGAVYFAKNGTFQASGDPTSGASKTNAAFTFTTGGSYAPWVADNTSGVGFTWLTNFGNPPFSISSGNSDANGYGNFEYAVPSGYYSLCTKNLAEYG
tara:strand:+ start:33 stop:1466 length:1434 start_codon:yes stop_codon:yes gene_type:complete